MSWVILATALLCPPCLLLAFLGWAGAARRAAVLTDHLQSARQLLRLQERALCERASADIIPFPVPSRVEGPRQSPPDSTA